MNQIVRIVTGDADTLHDGGKELIDKLQAAGHADAVFTSIPGGGHVFDHGSKTEADWEKRNKVYGVLIDAIARGQA